MLLQKLTNQSEVGQSVTKLGESWGVFEPCLASNPKLRK